MLTINNKHLLKYKVLFETFFEKRKENDLYRKYMHFGGSAKNPSSLYFADITKKDDSIAFSTN